MQGTAPQNYLSWGTLFTSKKKKKLKIHPCGLTDPSILLC